MGPLRGLAIVVILVCSWQAPGSAATVSRVAGSGSTTYLGPTYQTHSFSLEGLVFDAPGGPHGIAIGKIVTDQSTEQADCALTVLRYERDPFFALPVLYGEGIDLASPPAPCGFHWYPNDEASGVGTADMGWGLQRAIVYGVALMRTDLDVP